MSLTLDVHPNIDHEHHSLQWSSPAQFITKNNTFLQFVFQATSEEHSSAAHRVQISEPSDAFIFLLLIKCLCQWTQHQAAVHNKLTHSQ